MGEVRQGQEQLPGPLRVPSGHQGSAPGDLRQVQDLHGRSVRRHV